MSKVIVDYRERASGIIKELAKRDLDVEIKQLVVADFIIQSKDKDGNPHTIGIEKKTQNDFINSIIDKRILSQLTELKRHFSIPLLILEGKENIYSLRNFHPNAIRGMLASIAIDYQIPIIHSKNYRDTAALIAIIAKRLEKPARPISLLDRRKPLTLKEKQQYLIESLPGVGPKIAETLLKKLKTIKSIFNASEEDLKEVDKIGPKKAKEIKKLIDSIYED